MECKACLGLLQPVPAAFERVGGLCRYHAHCGPSGFLLRRHRQRRNSLLHFRYVVGRLVRVWLIGSRAGYSVALRCRLYFRRQNRSRGRRMRSAFQCSRIGRGNLRLWSRLPSKQAKQSTRERIIVIGRRRGLRFRRRHSRRWNAAANLGEENSIHSAVQSAMNWRHWSVGCDQLGVLDLVGVLLP